MMSEATQENVPELRFPEFSGEWEKKHLKEINTQMQSGLSRLLKDEDIGLPVIRSNNIIDGKLDISDIKYWYKEDPQGANTQNYLLAEGDLLINFINSIAQIGKVALYENKLNRDAIITTNLMRLKFTDIVNTRFIFYFFLTEKYKLYIQSITKPAVNQASFTTKDLEKLLILLPKTPEQKKIASFLSAMDEKIEQITRKKELLEQYKKGMMQKIFSQVIRFKDAQGNAFPDWVEKRLGEVADLITKGTTPTSIGFSFTDIGINFIKAESIDESYQFNQNKVAKISVECHEYLKRSQLHKNDILFSIAGTLGRTAIVTKGILPANTNQALSIVRLKKIASVRFINFFLNSQKITKRIGQLLSVGAQPNLSLEQIGRLTIPFPHPEEQQKIADFLSSLDDKIDLIATELSQTQTFKKGLLQRMFV